MTEQCKIVIKVKFIHNISVFHSLSWWDYFLEYYEFSIVIWQKVLIRNYRSVRTSNFTCFKSHEFLSQLPFLSLSNFVILWNTVLLKSWYRVIWIIFGYWPFLRNGVFIRFYVALNWINSKEEKRSTFNWLKIKGNQ